jgi:DnaA family protein
MNQISQLTLEVQLPDDETFDSFYVGDNAVVVKHLKEFITVDNMGSPNGFFIFGHEGVGKSHLLHACCSFAESIKRSAFCMSFSHLTLLSTDVLDGLEHLDIICLDDIHLIAGDITWQNAVFDLFNRITENNKKIIISGDTSVKNLAITLPDLASRLAWGNTESVKELSEQDKIVALQYHANQRGMQLSDEVAKFLLSRLARSMSHLIVNLDLLDKASIREQRKITIPFIKTVLLNS